MLTAEHAFQLKIIQPLAQGRDDLGRLLFRVRVLFLCGQLQKNLAIFNNIVTSLPAVNGVLQLTNSNLGLAGLVRIIPKSRIRGLVFKLGEFSLFAG